MSIYIKIKMQVESITCKTHTNTVFN